jgi:hypothetical protein
LNANFKHGMKFCSTRRVAGGLVKNIIVAAGVAVICIILAATIFDWVGDIKGKSLRDPGSDLFIYRIFSERQRQSVIPRRFSLRGNESSITQYGITWIFDKKYLTGRFINGDWWIMGPVTITGIDPAPGQGRNGSMINPRPGRYQAYDDRVDGFKPPLGLQVPFVLNPGESLISSISSPQTNPPGYSTQNPVWLRSASILTCLAAPPPEDSFRPPYCGRDKPIYRKAALRKYILPSFKPVDSRPSLAAIEKKFERPWLDHKVGWSGRNMHPYENMVDYGGSISTDIGEGALTLLLDENIIGSKETLLIRYVQLGIDLYGIAANGGSWPSDGGHASGRKFPILFAGLMLNEPKMLHLNPSVRFGEDDQTFYVTQQDLKRIHQSSSGNPNADGGYSPIMLGMPEWGIRHFSEPERDNWRWSAKYRRNLTAGSWCGWVLAARILKLKELWRHDALFDYQDRYMETEPIVGPLIDGHVDQGFSPFARDFWNKYRKSY